MSSSLGKNCVYCHKVFVASDRVKSVGVAPRDWTVNYREIINFVIPKLTAYKYFHQLLPVREKRLEDRFVCAPCGIALKDAYTVLKALETLRCPQSLISSSCSSPISQSVQTETVLIVRAIPAKPPQTPIKKRLEAAWNVKKNRISATTTIKWLVHREMEVFVKYTSLRNFIAGDSFIPPDEELLAEMEDWCPTVLQIFYGIFSTKPKLQLFSSALRTAIGLAAFEQSRECCGFQKTVSMLLYKSGASYKLYNIFNELRLCSSYSTTNRVLDKLVDAHDKDLKLWRDGASQFLNCYDLARKGFPMPNCNISGDTRQVTVSSDVELPIGLSLLRQSSIPTNFNRMQEHANGGNDITVVRLRKPSIPQKSDFYYGIVFSFDNLNKMVIPKEYNSRVKSKMINMTSAFAVFNRIPIPANEAVAHHVRTKCVDLPLCTWQLTKEEIDIVKDDHIRRVKFHLALCHPLFQSLKNQVEGFPTHQYSNETSQASRYVSLGIYNEDENTTKGMLEVIRRLKEYCPQINGDVKQPIVAFGDGLTSDRLRKSQESCVNAVAMDNRNKEIFPGNSSWHKQVRLLQDDIDLFMPNTSACKSPGTLAFFRSRFGHSQASCNVDASFNYTMALMKFSLKSYIVAMAQQLLGIPNVPLAESKKVFEKELGAKDATNWLMATLDNISKAIVDFEWKNVTRSFEKEKVYCICRKPWVDDDPMNEEYIGCDNMECEHFEWYHKSCLKNQKQKSRKFRLPPRGEKNYFCCADCDMKDNVLEYSKCLMNAGLNQDCFYASIRSGDGDRMKIFHKLHMVRLFNHNHKLYFRVYHYILSLMENGPPTVRHDLLNNSTINFRGASNGNLSLDYANEVLNKFIKESLVVSKGNLTTATGGRRTQTMQWLDELRKHVEKETGLEDHNSSSKHYNKMMLDVIAAAEIILKTELLIQKGKRSHEGLEKFTYHKAYVNNVCAYQAELLRLSTRVDLVYQISMEIKSSPSQVEPQEEFSIRRPKKVTNTGP